MSLPVSVTRTVQEAALCQHSIWVSDSEPFLMARAGPECCLSVQHRSWCCRIAPSHASFCSQALLSLPRALRHHSNLPYDRRLYTLLFPFSTHVPPRDTVWSQSLLWRCKTVCHLEVETTVTTNAPPRRVGRCSVRSVIRDELQCLFNMSGVQMTMGSEFSLPCLAPGLGGRRAQVLSIGS